MGANARFYLSPLSLGAAVSILETYITQARSAPLEDGESDREVRGLARLVQVSPEYTLVDLTLRGVAPGTYKATIREYGDLKDGATSTGPVWNGYSGGDQAGRQDGPRGFVGTVEIDQAGRGSVFLNKAVQVWELIGHAMVVSRQDEQDGVPLKNDENTVVGVIARSAGVWENDKTVCSCTGKTLWEERKDEVKKGML